MNVRTDRVGSLLDQLDSTESDAAGFGQYAHGLDSQRSFIAIVWCTNRELIHHLAEVALLRDLWHHSQGAA